MLEFLVVTGSIALVVPLTMYFSGRSAGRGTWGQLLQGYKQHGTGAYRAQISPVWVEGKPPLVVHLAAISSFILGQMVVPGALALLIGLLVGVGMLSHGNNSPGDCVILVLVASGPTGLIIGGRLLGVGLGLLQRAEDAVEKARKLARFSLIHNGVLLLSMGLIYALGGESTVIFPAVYQCISIAQAILLYKAARAVDAHGEAEARDRELAVRPPQWAGHTA